MKVELTEVGNFTNDRMNTELEGDVNRLTPIDHNTRQGSKMDSNKNRSTVTGKKQIRVGYNRDRQPSQISSSHNTNYPIENHQMQHD